MKRRLGFLGLLLLLVIFPLVRGGYPLSLLTKILIFAIFAMSLDLLVGYIRLPSLGHAAFLGVASYTIGILYAKKLVVSVWLAFPLALLVAVITAALFGLLVLRCRTSYFLIITVSLAQVLWGIAFTWRSFSGGQDGIPGIPRPVLTFLPWSLWDAVPYFYFVLFFFVLTFLLLRRVVRSPFGLVLAGIRESEVRMRSLGYHVWLYKYFCFMISGLFAGLAGILLVYFTGFVSPEVLSVSVSAEGLLMVLFGGAGTLVGPILGAGAIIVLENVVSAYTQRWALLLGMLYVAVVLFTPKGILQLFTGVMKKKGASRESAHS